MKTIGMGIFFGSFIKSSSSKNLSMTSSALSLWRLHCHRQYDYHRQRRQSKLFLLHYLRLKRDIIIADIILQHYSFLSPRHSFSIGSLFSSLLRHV